ncbi:DUF4105 domain-containing protein [bacterium]|nr:DUF4105 domain-containing protein [bacterium]
MFHLSSSECELTQKGSSLEALSLFDTLLSVTLIFQNTKRLMQKFIFFFSLLSVLNSAFGVVSEAILQQVAQSKPWHRLLHYKKTLPFWKLQSEVDGAGFFFSPEGKTDPLAELKASWAAFSRHDLQVGKFKLHPQCAFPARFEFLQKALGHPVQKVKCEKVEEMMQVADPDSVTLVFSSAYPNNPASMFGHTFLRINRKIPTGQKKQDMLDYGVSFAAAVGPDENPLAFIAFGLTGGYRGQFSYVPYYVKINEYNNSESRDIWEYDLALSPEESRTLLAHVWEIETNSYFDYFFFDENCSYQMLTLIEAAKPDWNISNFNLSTIPGETLKKIMTTPGVVQGVRYRPSLRKKMVAQASRLNTQQQVSLKKVLDGRVSPKEIQDPFVLDTAVASLFYEKQEAEGQWDESKKLLQASVLLQRSYLGKIESPETLTSEEVFSRPDQGHFPYRFSWSPGWITAADLQGNFQELGFKTAYHDLFNSDRGFQRYSHIDFPQVYFRYYPQNGKLLLDNLELLHITSLFPLSFVESRASWKLQIAYANSREFSCWDCKSAQLRGGMGATLNLFDPRTVVYGLLLAHAEAGSALSRNVRLGPELQVAVITNPWESFKSGITGNVTWDGINNDNPSRFRVQLLWENALSLGQSWEFRLSYGSWFYAFNRSYSRPYQEAKFSTHFYF